MADFLPTLIKEPTTALKGLKPTNPILKDIFLAIPEHERRGVTMPDRGHALKQWLEQWAIDRQKGGGAPIDEPAAPAAAAPAASSSSFDRAAEQRSQPQQQQQQQQQQPQYDDEPEQPPQQSQRQLQFDDRQQQPAAQQQQFQQRDDGFDQSRTHSHQAGSGGQCASCAEKDVTIRKLTAMVQNLLEQMDDLTLQARGDLTMLLGQQQQ